MFAMVVHMQMMFRMQWFTLWQVRASSSVINFLVAVVHRTMSFCAGARARPCDTLQHPKDQTRYGMLTARAQHMHSTRMCSSLGSTHSSLSIGAGHPQARAVLPPITLPRGGLQTQVPPTEHHPVGLVERPFVRVTPPCMSYG